MNLGINRNAGGAGFGHLLAERAEDPEARASFRASVIRAMEAFFETVIDMGFTIVNLCYPMSPASETDGLRAILAGAPWAERVYLTCRAEHLAMTREFCAWDEVESMWRMALQRTRFRPAEGDWVRLTPAHADELVKLYALGGGPAYSVAQLEHGVFCGTFVDRRLVAVAGTHLVSPTYGVAAVGNVFAHPGYRGRGYGTTVTSAVVAELLGRGIGDIVLNVNQGNEVAIGIYERLGFERYCPFLEGPARALRVPDSG